MLDFYDKRFMGECRPADKPCPPEKPRYTMTEELHHLARRTHETIDRVLRFEEDMQKKFDELMATLTSDNVIFKTTLQESWSAFLQEVKNEVNLFEANVDNTIALYQKDIESNYATLSDDVRRQILDNLATYEAKVDAFELAYIDAFDAFKEVVNGRVADAETYMKTNLAETMRNLVDNLVIEGVIDTVTTEAYGKLTKDIYGQALSAEEIQTIVTAKALDVVNITVANKVYDFKGATITTLNIETTGATIKNAIVLNCNVKPGSRNCSLDNVRFENAEQCVTFGVNTWAFNFRDCSFIGNGDTIAMNAGENTNTTLILTNCYFYNCSTLIYATGGFVCSIIGGWCDEAHQIVYVTGGNCDITITGFDFEALDNVFKAEGYTFSNVAVSGTVGIVQAVVDFMEGIVNLTYNATINNNIKLFSANCPETKYCNVPTKGACSWRLVGSPHSNTFNLYVPPLSTIPVVDGMFVSKITFDNANAEVYTNFGKYLSGTTLNAVTPVYVRNLAELGNNVQLTVTHHNYR